MTAQDISTSIKNTLTAVRDNRKVVFKDILEYATNTFNGYPSVTITGKSVGAEFATTNENIRTYVFEITIYIKDGGATAWTQARRLQDLASNALDKTRDLGNRSWVVEPTRVNEIISEQISSGEHLKAVLELIVKTIEIV